MNIQDYLKTIGRPEARQQHAAEPAQAAGSRYLFGRVDPGLLVHDAEERAHGERPYGFRLATAGQEMGIFSRRH